MPKPPLIIGKKAQIPNPRLAAFKPFIGKWRSEGKHSFLPGATLSGFASFEWMEGGSFLVVRTEIDHPEIPASVSVIGSDDKLKKYSMQYFDERGVSRAFEVEVAPKKITWHRTAPKFSQRFTCTLADDGNTMTGVSELCTDDVTWKKDLELTYSRIA